MLSLIFINFIRLFILLNILFQKLLNSLDISFNTNFIIENITTKGEIKIVKSKLIIRIIPIISFNNIQINLLNIFIYLI